MAIIETSMDLRMIGQWIGAEVTQEQIPEFIWNLAKVITDMEDNLRRPDGSLGTTEYREIIGLGRLDRMIMCSAISLLKTEGPNHEAARKIVDFQTYSATLAGVDMLTGDSVQISPEDIMQEGIRIGRNLADRIEPEEADGFCMRVTNLVRTYE